MPKVDDEYAGSSMSALFMFMNAPRVITARCLTRRHPARENEHDGVRTSPPSTQCAAGAIHLPQHRLLLRK
jgi:hypothetical protein